MADFLLNREPKYWWVNQNQTFKQEFKGGYLWSPRRNRDGGFNPFYENMREMAPGDIVFSFVDKQIKAISLVRRCAAPSPKPEEFGDIGPHWHPTLGWMVAVTYKILVNNVTPADNMDILGPLLPADHSPLRPTGIGNQAYLFAIDKPLGEVLVGLIGRDAEEFAHQGFSTADAASIFIDDRRTITDWENAEQKKIDADPKIDSTEKERLVKARLGQGLFKQRVMKIEKACRITKVDNPEHLIGSHIKPWRESGNTERLDGENGLLLTPTIDHLFDRGFISFKNNGDLILSPVADKFSLTKMGVASEAGVNVGTFTLHQQHYLDFHRDMVLLKRTR